MSNPMTLLARGSKDSPVRAIAGPEFLSVRESARRCARERSRPCPKAPLPGAERMLELQRDLRPPRRIVVGADAESLARPTAGGCAAAGRSPFLGAGMEREPGVRLPQAGVSDQRGVSAGFPIRCRSKTDAPKERIQFLTRQYVDAMAPSNFAATNPEFLKTAVETKGESITRGIQNLLKDLEKAAFR